MDKNVVYTSAMKKIFYGAGIYFILGIIGYILMFLFKILVARQFTPAEFGLFELAVTILGVMVVFSDFGLNNSIQRYISIYLEDKKYGLIKGFRLFAIYGTLCCSLFFSLLLFYFSSDVATFFNLSTELTLFLKIISLGIPLRAVNTIFTNLLLSEKKAFQAGFGYNVLEKIVLIIGIMVIIKFNLSLIYLFLLFILSLMSSLIITWVFYLFRTKFKEKTLFNSKEWLYFSVPLLFSGVLYFMISWIDNFIIARLISSTSVGIYSVAYSLSSSILFISTTFLTLFIPVMAELFIKKKQDFVRVFEQVTKWVFMGVVFFGLLLFSFASQLINILFGEAYVASNVSLMILSVLFILSGVLSFYFVIILLKGDTRFLFFNNLVFLIITTSLGIILAKRFGIEGVAFASGLGFLMLRLSEFFWSKKYFKFSINTKIFLKIFLVGVLSVISVKLLAVFMRNVIMHEFIKLIVAFVVYVFVFLSLFLLFKILNEEDVAFLLVLEKSVGLDLKIVKLFLKKLI